VINYAIAPWIHIKCPGLILQITSWGRGPCFGNRHKPSFVKLYWLSLFCAEYIHGRLRINPACKCRVRGSPIFFLRLLFCWAYTWTPSFLTNSQVLQCVAVCCSVLYSVVERCSVMQCTAAYCSVLQFVDAIQNGTHTRTRVHVCVCVCVCLRAYFCISVHMCVSVRIGVHMSYSKKETHFLTNWQIAERINSPSRTQRGTRKL